MTQRKRFFWAAWWTGAPQLRPFLNPDAAHGGARTWEAALAEAQAAAGRHLVVIESYWARAFMCVLRGQPIPARPAARASAPEPRATQPEHAPSSWSVLGLEPGASALAIRRAFRLKALETHPDRGGDAEQFRAAMRAYERLLAADKRRKPRRRRTR
jgi:DnaJ domain